MLNKPVKYGSVAVGRSANGTDFLIQVTDSLDGIQARACLSIQDILNLIEDLEELKKE